MVQYRHVLTITFYFPGLLVGGRFVAASDDNRELPSQLKALDIGFWKCESSLNQDFGGSAYELVISKPRSDALSPPSLGLKI